MTNRLTRAYGYAELTLAADTENAGALRLMDELSALMVEVQLCQSRCVRHVGGVSGLDQLIEGREALRGKRLHPAGDGPAVGPYAARRAGKK